MSEPSSSRREGVPPTWIERKVLHRDENGEIESVTSWYEALPPLPDEPASTGFRPGRAGYSPSDSGGPRYRTG